MSYRWGPSNTYNVEWTIDPCCKSYIFMYIVFKSTDNNPTFVCIRMYYVHMTQNIITLSNNESFYLAKFAKNSLFIWSAKSRKCEYSSTVDIFDYNELFRAIKVVKKFPIIL